MSSRLRSIWPPIIIAVVFLGIWQLIVVLNDIKPYLLPSPTLIAGNFFKDIFTHGAMAVSANSRNPEKAIEVYDLIRNDKENYMLFNFGIEGTDYIITADGKLAFGKNELTEWLTFWDELRKAGAVPPAEVTALENGFETSPIVARLRTSTMSSGTTPVRPLPPRFQAGAVSRRVGT